MLGHISTSLVCAIAWLALVSSGCATFAPPVRGVAYGAPGRLAEGQVEIGGGNGGIALPDNGGPHIGFGLRDWLMLEGGANLRIDGGNLNGWAMGFAGARFSLPPPKGEGGFVGDLEFGLGAGVGGARDENRQIDPHCVSVCPDGRGAFDRFAFGSYQGLGLGLRHSWFTMFVRARIEESSATNVPVTLWPSVMLAGEARIGSHAALTVGAGWLAMINTADHASGVAYQISLAIFFDGWKRRTPLAR